jgi:tetratricopeptide (TPR) repeat protein
VRVEPNNYLAMAYRADELRTSGHNAEALLLAAHAVAISPYNPSARISYGLALAADKKYPEAVTQLTAATHLSPGDESAWGSMGSLREMQASDVQPTDPAAAVVFRKQAIRDFREALKFSPYSKEINASLAYDLAVLGQMDEAIAVWQDLLSWAPTFAQAQGDLADALRLKQDLPGAVEHYRAALAAGSKNPAWETELAYLVATNPLATATDVQPMVAIAKDACDQSQDRSAAALDAYAASLARVGRFDDAVTAATQGIAQANAEHEPAVAAGMRKRLTLYQQQLPYVVSGSPSASTQPTTAPS